MKIPIRLFAIVILILVILGCNLPTRITQPFPMATSTATQEIPVIKLVATPIPTELPTAIPPTLPAQITTQSEPTLVIPEPTSDPSSSPDNIFGITIYTLDDPGGLNMALQAGIGWTRKDFIWSDIERQPGDRFWNSDLEQGLINLSSRGIKPIIIIEGTPAWALKAGFNCGAVDENQMPILAQFAYDLVARYSVPPYNVKYWELWNEPDAAGILGCWGDPSDSIYYGGTYYGQMLQVIYPKIKEADPQAQVLIGGLLLDCDPINPPEGRTCVESNFLKGILESGAGPNFDGVSFHAYDFYTGQGTYGNPNWHSSSISNGPVSIIKATYVNKLLSQYGYVDKYLLNTETAVFWGRNVMVPPCEPGAPPDMEALKVNYVIQSYAAAVAKGWKANIWYSAFGVRCSGLLNSDMTPKPAYFAYQFVQRKLGQAIFIKEINVVHGINIYEYQLQGRILWVLWSRDGREYTINLSRLPVEVNQINEDGLAEQQVIALSYSLDKFPLFIEVER